MTQTWRLYVITDQELAAGRSHGVVARAAIEGGADAIQLRDKSASSRALFEMAKELRAITREAGVSFIVNDRLDIALAVDADGLHVGQSDLPATEARRLLGPDKILGVSASSVEEAREAEQHGANYLGVGAIFEARDTKADAGAPRGISVLTLLSKHSTLPIVAIGGIKHDNVADVIRAGAQCAAVISAIVAADDIAEAARRMKERIAAAEQGDG